MVARPSSAMESPSMTATSSQARARGSIQPTAAMVMDQEVVEQLPMVMVAATVEVVMVTVGAGLVEVAMVEWAAGIHLVAVQ